ncbi:MAG: glycine zipper 2TM domain-containing protein [Proteobacteria bacterium]|nr:glycine zipper 2TM domain-containing protein [Pseudomonadota bacterium]
MNANKIITFALLAGLASPLVACGEQGLTNDQIGMGLGGVAGGFLGSQFGEGSGKVVASVAGALLGAWAGSKVAQGMTAQDQGYYNNAATKAATVPVGQEVTWYNPNSGAQGTITPVRTGQTSEGYACREYQQTVTIGGKTERAYGTACKQPDGSWKIIN